MSKVYDYKGKVKKFVAKVFDLDVPQGAPEVQEVGLQSNASGATSPPKNPIPSFESMSLNDSRQQFIGGFHPNATPSPGSLPRPPAMPTPMHNYPSGSGPSLTMQYATYLSPEPPASPVRRLSAPGVPSPFSLPASGSTPGTPSASSHKPALPPLTKPNRPRASSTPPSPSSATSTPNQCCGVTKTGKRCTRQVKGGPAYANVFRDDSSVEKFCFQHTKELLNPTGFYARSRSHPDKNSEWIEFIDYIPPYLHPDTQVALRVEMEKIRSKSDVLGYIYTFEIRDPSDKSKLSLKVGRTVNVVQRLHQWGKQCGSKEQVLRGWYPGEVQPDDQFEAEAGGRSLMKGRIKAGGRGVWCHRLERLIHLELADLAINQPYLEPGWKPFIKGPGKGKMQQRPHLAQGGSSGGNSRNSSPTKGGKKSTPFVVNGIGNGADGPCKDCGTVHKEIFSFERIKSGPYKGREWDAMVKRVIEDWGTFVENYV